MNFHLENSNGDVSEPYHLSMVLESDPSLSRQILESSLELVCGAVRVLSHLLPVVEVNAKGGLSIKPEGNLGAQTSELSNVPLPDWLRIVATRSDAIVKGCVKLSGRKNLFGFFLKTDIVHQLNFKASIDWVFLIATIENS